MVLTEQQLTQLIRETVARVVTEGKDEYAYHEKQHQPSEEEHAEWIKRKAAAKRRYYDSQKKDDDKPIDHYEYKHGKGNFPVMKERTVSLSESQFYDFIKESVMRVIKETTLDYDMDNFSGRWGRGPRYDILVDGEVYYSDVPDESVDRLCADLERQGYENIQVQE